MDPALLPVPHRLRWALITTAVAVVLLFCLWTLGEPPQRIAAFDQSLLAWLPYRLMTGLSAVVTTGKGAGLPARLTVLSLFVLLFFTCRSWCRACVAAAPGPVDVCDFEDGGSAVDAPRVALRSLLAKQLSETRLYPPSTGRAPANPTVFLDVAAGQAAPTNWMSAVSTALGLAMNSWPQAAYRVNVTVLKRDQRPEFGMTVTVTSLALGGRSAMTTLWGRSWEDVTCHVGYWVMAAILPVTRQVRLPPWRLWRGRVLPWGLFQAYNEGRRHHDERQFDLALWQYGEVLRADPYNIEVRLLVADVLEQLGLYLEALDIYSGARHCIDEGRGGCATTSRGWFREKLERFSNRIWHRWNERPGLKLRYRYANTLAATEWSAHEWLVDDAKGERAEVREQMKERLRASLAERFTHYVQLPNGESIDRDFASALDGRSERDKRLLEVLFRLMAMRELQDLFDELPVGKRVRRLGRSRGGELTGRSLLILRDVWAPLRVSEALSRYLAAPVERSSVPPQVAQRLISGLLGCGPQVATPWTPSVLGEVLQLEISWRPEMIDAAINQASGGRVRQLLAPMTYADHYHAACAYSIALKWSPQGSESRTQLARKAVWHLRAALASVESGVAARVRDWVLAGDLDLTELRSCPEFQHFERDLFPRPGPVPARPAVSFHVCSRAYARQLILDAAQLLEQQWHENWSRGGDVHDIAEWLRGDVDLWEALHQITDDRAWYWRDRARFIRLVQDTVDPMAVAGAGFPPPYPRYEEVNLSLDGSGTAEATASASPTDLSDTTAFVIDQMLQCLVGYLAERAASMGRVGTARAQSRDHRGILPSLRELHDLCTVRASEWQRVAEHLQRFPIDIERPPQPEERLRP
ncbi:tetratricopeptide repeat protein [Micromonospora coxensis]|uniref:Tetratricopeptide repeat-containing protein n=1 Tax=Micromonospora coxensis TaxID=356852 RepID=A0A1C5HAM7_9ACTN|nr:hypothetical protein [Micromonospora coxensis]SCG43075.1 hypothetical protein GA0070614_1045 [Micromonospora coxensis]